MSEQPAKSAIDWKKFRDERVPEVAADDPVLQRVRAQLAALDKYPPMDGNEPTTGRSYAALRQELRQSLLDEIERYRWRRAGFTVTQEMLDAVRE
jgi:hypothetical protein